MVRAPGNLHDRNADGLSSHNSSSSSSSSPPVPLWRASIILITCIGYVGGSAYLIVLIASAFVRLADLDSTTVGSTLVAFGTEIPDAISSITLARHGYMEGALASVIGSQVINLSVVVGFSSLLACLLERTAGEDGTLIGLDISQSEMSSLWMLVCAVLAVIASFVYFIFPCYRICELFECKSSTTSTLTKANARLLLIIWLILYLLFGFRHEI
jgi:Ca2+/Na+ antiporter